MQDSVTLLRAVTLETGLEAEAQAIDLKTFGVEALLAAGTPDGLLFLISVFCHYPRVSVYLGFPIL